MYFLCDHPHYFSQKNQQYKINVVFMPKGFLVVVKQNSAREDI